MKRDRTNFILVIAVSSYWFISANSLAEINSGAALADTLSIRKLISEPALENTAINKGVSPKDTHAPSSKESISYVYHHEEISGILLDQTTSMPAKGFTEAFTSSWRNYPKSENYTIVIKESVSALWGSSISISSEERTIFRARLNRRNDNSAAGTEAAKAVIDRLQRRSSIDNIVDSTDVSYDEF